jgi:mannosyl-glycoprotein endo-beta-N-acetylglucosaminidase
MTPPQRPTSLFFDSLAAFAGWKPGADLMDPFRVGLVPLRPRSGSSAAPWMLTCHDMMNGYLESGDRYPQGTSDVNTYNFDSWQYTDLFIYFSHHRVTIPPPWWINAAHQNGISALGTLIFENAVGTQDLSDLVNTRGTGTSDYLYVDLLVEAAAYYGFDGWLWNVESNLPADVSVAAFTRFVQALTEAMHTRLPLSQVIWYDALTVDGTVDCQNTLNDKNKAFFLATDGILVNYSWTLDHIKTSVTTANAAGRSPLRVYTGTDVWGRGTYGGFDTYVGVGAAGTGGTSACVFGPGWTFEKAADRANFLQRDARLWAGTAPGQCPGTTGEGIARYVPVRGTVQGLPFATNFDQGQGNKFWVQGGLGSPAAWSNLSLQGVLPTWRFCTDGGAGPFTAAWDQSAAFDGGTSLRFSASGAAPGDRARFRLFALRAPAGGATVSWTWQRLDPTDAPQMSPILRLADGSSVTLLVQGTRDLGNGWMLSTATAGPDLAGKTVIELGMLVGPSMTGRVPSSYGVRIGTMSMVQQPWPAPVSVRGLAPQGATWAGGAVTLNLLWGNPPGAARFYDVWQVHRDGTATWLLRAACNAAWVDSLAPGAGDGGTVTLAVQPVDYAGQRQPLAQAARVTLVPGVPALTLAGEPEPAGAE